MPMQILHLEDSSTDAELIGMALRRHWPECRIRQVSSGETFQAALTEGRYDVILSDYSMPGFDGLTALEYAHAKCPETPFLFLSGMIGEERAVEALKRGATDYIIKDRPARLVPAIRQALALVAESAQRRKVEEALRENDERIWLITENVAELISVVDQHGRRTYCNRAARALLGDADTQLGSDWFEGIDAADLPRVRAAFAEIVGCGEGRRIDFRRCLRNGTVRDFEAHGAVLRDAPDGVVNVILVSRDVTERREAELRLREQASLLDKARDAIIATGLDNRISYWNASAERMYGFKAADVIGRRYDELGLGFDLERFAAAHAEVLAKGEWRGEFRLTTRDGQTVLVESTWSLVVENDGHPRSILAIDTDVTERRKLEAQLLRAQRIESIGTLAGGVAHDLNNVLTPILLTLDLLSGHTTSLEDRQLIEKTRASATHGAALVRQLLAFARGADGERASVDPAAAFATVVPLIRQSLPPSIQLNVSRDDAPWRIEANGTQLNQVLVNLALNARDAMPQGGVLEISTTNVEVGPELAAANPGTQPGRFLKIAVSDTGLGIAPGIIERIFDPFFTTKAAGKGTGLGLSMVAGILKSHRGFVQVESQVGRGTSFFLYFPALAPDVVTARTEPRAQVNAAGERVLLIDDEPAVRETLRLLLQRAGYSIVPAADAGTALREFERNPGFSLVITDMMLPDRSGVDVVKSLRAQSPRLPIIAISGMMGSGHFDELLRLQPPVQCLSKPLLPRVLLGAAQQAIAVGGVSS